MSGWETLRKWKKSGKKIPPRPRLVTGVRGTASRLFFASLGWTGKKSIRHCGEFSTSSSLSSSPSARPRFTVDGSRGDRSFYRSPPPLGIILWSSKSGGLMLFDLLPRGKWMDIPWNVMYIHSSFLSIREGREKSD